MEARASRWRWPALIALLAALLPPAWAEAGALNPIDAPSLQRTVETLAKDMLVPGAVVILKTPRGDFSTRYGVNAYKGTAPTGFDQHIRIGSNTKTWIGTVILQQVQEGRLKLDDPVSKYRPDVPNGRNISIEQLLSMRSGLFNYSTTNELNKTLDEQPLKVWTPDELLAMAYAQPAQPQGQEL